jgi:guanylate kinase
MKLLTLTGPSCSGKTTLLNELVANHGFKALVSCTTRPPRKGEEYGKDYYFLPVKIFDLVEKDNGFMETVTFNGYRYGLSFKELKDASDSGKNPVVIVEPNGLKQIAEFCKTHNIEMLRTFIGGDLEVLIRRYLQRSADEDMSKLDTSNRHARRLVSLVHEQATWINEGDSLPSDQYVPKSLYNVIIPEYNSSNQDSVIKQIKEMYGQG